MRQASLTLAGLIFTGTVIAQDLPPGVLLVSRVKSHINEELQRLVGTLFRTVSVKPG